MKLGIRLHLAGLSLSNTVSILEIFGVSRARSTAHNWVHKAELQPEASRSPDYVAVDETVIQLNNEQYWLYAAVDSETNEVLHTTLEPTTNRVIAHAFFAELREKHHVDDAVFLIDGSHSLKDAVVATASISDMNVMEIGIVSNVSFENKTTNYQFLKLFQ